MVLKYLLLLVTLLICLGNSDCTIVKGQIVGTGFTFTIPPKTIKGGGILSEVLQTLDFNFPLQGLVPGNIMTSNKIKEVYLNLIGIRSVVAQDYGADGKPDNKRIQDASLIGSCANGQPTIDFIKSFSLHVQKSGTDNKVRIAHFCNSRDPEACAEADMPETPRSGFCGIFVEIDEDPATGAPYNLKDFFPSYEVTTTTVGTKPVNDTDIAGFVVVDWDAEVRLPEQK